MPQAGVTLVELVIAIFLGGLVFLGLGYVFGLNYGLWMRGQDRMVLHAGAARALEEIVRSAGQASGFSLPEDGELRIFSPPSPIGDSATTGVASETVFRFQDGKLLRNGATLVPHLGDSAAVRVAAFDPRLVIAEGSGVRTLQVRLSLHTLGGPSAPAETLHFETAAHGRNVGLGLVGNSGGVAESNAGLSNRMGSSL
jgi:Tfp pilus assembly protein PilW